MKLASIAIADNQPIPSEYAFCARTEDNPAASGGNRNPDLNWNDLPEGARSLVLVCHDPDVPSRFDDANKAGRTVPAGMLRVNFYHWVLIDIPPETNGIAEAEFSDRVTPGGKPGPDARYDTRQGLNSFTDMFEGDKDMAGDYYGYDGPCPPWNDEIAHRYVFTLYALDIVRCPVENRFTGPNVLKAIEGHVLNQASLTGLYALNPDAR